MPDWSKGGLLGSLRARAVKEVRDHRRANVAMRGERRPISMRILSACFGEMGVFGLLFPYAVVAALAPLIEAVFVRPGGCIICLLSSASHDGVSLDAVNAQLLAAQVVMIGLLFPMAIGLVSLILQSRDAGGNADVQVYFSESLARKVAASGISLSIAIAFQFLWPVHVAANGFGLHISGDFSKEVLTIFHALWLILNLAAMWHFLTTSLAFIRPHDRARLREQFAANVAIPHDLQERIQDWLYQNDWPSELNERCAMVSSVPNLSIYFGASMFDQGKIEIATPSKSGKILVDIKMIPLAWAVERWFKRWAKIKPVPDSNAMTATLLFPPILGEALADGGIICRRNHAPRFDWLERIIVRRSFVFRKRAS